MSEAPDRTTRHTLIVARMQPASRERVAEVFAESDDTELPQLLGVARRTLFDYHGLYFHLVETDVELATPLSRVRSHPLFVDVNTKLAPHVEPYSPDWREPRDAMASSFYEWRRPAG